MTHSSSLLLVTALLQWLNDRITDNCSSAVMLNTENLWVNSIKTHCYVSLPSESFALEFIKAVHNCRWPDTGSIVNTGLLQADFTTVSATDADTSMEATMKPSEWKDYNPSDEVVNVVSSSSSSSSSAPVRGRGAVPITNGLLGVFTKAMSRVTRDEPAPPQLPPNPQTRVVTQNLGEKRKAADDTKGDCLIDS